MCFNQRGDISILSGSSLKLVDKFTYLGSSVSSTEKDINTWLTKAWTAIDKLSVIWKSNLTDKIKRNFFQAGVMSILLYGCTTRCTQEYCEQYWTSHGGSTPQSTSCTATYHPSRKLSKFDEPDMRDTTEEVRTNSLVVYSSGLLHMDEQRHDNRPEPTYSSSVPIRDVVLKTCRKQWTIEKGSERGATRWWWWWWWLSYLLLLSTEQVHCWSKLMRWEWFNCLFV